jgi:hypothetical protein
MGPLWRLRLEGPCSYGATVGHTAGHGGCSSGLPWGFARVMVAESRLIARRLSCNAVVPLRCVIGGHCHLNSRYRNHNQVHPFVENSHERPFSIIPMASTYGFLTKKSSPLEVQECDLWQGNICG